MFTPLTGSHCKLRPNIEGKGIDGVCSVIAPRIMDELSRLDSSVATMDGELERVQGTVVDFDRSLHSRMALVPTPLLRLKRCYACDQWHSSRASAAFPVTTVSSVQTPRAATAVSHRVCTPLTGWHGKFRPNTEGLRRRYRTESDAHRKTIQDMHARCAFFDRNLHSRMPLVPTPARLKRAGV
jgi:hypothetical protein